MFSYRWTWSIKAPMPNCPPPPLWIMAGMCLLIRQQPMTFSAYIISIALTSEFVNNRTDMMSIQLGMRIDLNRIQIILCCEKPLYYFFYHWGPFLCDIWLGKSVFRLARETNTRRTMSSKLASRLMSCVGPSFHRRTDGAAKAGARVHTIIMDDVWYSIHNIQADYR